MTQQQTDPEDRIDISDAGDDLNNVESLDENASTKEPTIDVSGESPEPAIEEIELELPAEAARYVVQLQSQYEEALNAKQRALADFRNYQRRALESEQQAYTDGARRMILALLPVLDHFDMALNQDLDSLTVDKLLNGVQIVRDEIGMALQRQGVDLIEPAVGDEFDPNRHEAMMRQSEEGIEPNHIVTILQTGYVMGDVVLRPAKVAVVPGDDD